MEGFTRGLVGSQDCAIKGITPLRACPYAAQLAASVGHRVTCAKRVARLPPAPANASLAAAG